MPLSKEADAARKRKARQDPAFRERENAAQRERYARPETGEKRRRYRRERYRFDREFRERELARNRRWHDDNYVPKSTRHSPRRRSVGRILEQQGTAITPAALREAADTEELRGLVEEQLKDDSHKIVTLRGQVSLDADREVGDDEVSYAALIGYEHDFETGETTPVNFMPKGPMFRSARTDVKRRKVAA